LIKFFRRNKISLMITGFNTDVKYKGKNFHIQTEDKGPKNPVVETLLYFEGMIVASKKTPYEYMVGESDLETKIKKLMVKQHQEMIADLKSGSFDELILGAGKAEKAKKEEESFEELLFKSISRFKKVHLNVQDFRFEDIYLKIKAHVKCADPEKIKNSFVEVSLKLPDGKRMFLVKEPIDDDGNVSISLPAPQVEKPYIIIVSVEVRSQGLDEKWFKVD